MSSFAANHPTSYASYSPGLTGVKVITSRRPTSLNFGWQRARLMVAGMLISGLVLVGTHIVELRSSAQSIITPNTSSSPSLITSAPVTQPAEPEPVTTATATNLPNSKQLQALLEAWQADYSGSTFGVVVKELSDTERSASINASQRFEAASLYKLFIADYVYDHVSSGNLSFDQTLNGMPATIGQCLKPMIVVSDNTCGESIGYAIGWPTLHNFVRTTGFNETTMSPVNQTTASDLAKYLTELQAGSLIKNPNYSNQLLGYMKNQIFRSAIPAGVPGVTVADKIGTNFNNWHDAAIVYGPKSTYILVIMSENSGSAPLKDLSSRVAKFFNQ